MKKYYDKKYECMSLKDLKNLQLELFNKQLKRAQKAQAYKGKLPKKIASLDEIKNIPFTTKNDLKNNFPYGFLAIPESKIKRFSSSSGTTGVPTLVFFSKKDLDALTNRAARQFHMAGIKNGDICQCMMGYGLFTGGFYNAKGVVKVATISPTGAGNTGKQIFFMKNLLSQMSTQDLKEINLKAAIVGGEKLSASFKKLVQTKYGIEIYEVYGMSEGGGPMAQECCEHNGMHIAEDHFYIEIIDPETGKTLPDGEYGELVFTSLINEAMPLIRYRTGDWTKIIPGKCKCGRTHKRLAPIERRIDDMLIINGVNVYPSQVEECIYNNLSAATNYLITIKEKNGLKKMSIDIELKNDLLKNAEVCENIKKKLLKELKCYITITPKLNFIQQNTLPEIQGKTKRIKIENQ